jgi:hypothetical protein
LVTSSAGAMNAAVQRMRACNRCEPGATNADRGATNAATNATAMTGATDANGNECPKAGVHDLCLRVRCVGDSNTKWQQQGVLGGAHNLLENRWSSTE